MLHNPQSVYDNPEKFWPYLTAATDDKFEGQHFDRKQAGNYSSTGQPSVSTSQLANLKDEIQATVSAFANSHSTGGLLVIGITSNGKPMGINHLTEAQQNTLTDINRLVINSAARVRIYEHAHDDKTSIRICLIYSPSTQNGICETPGNFPKAWIRVGSQNIALDQLKREQIRRDKKLLDFERMPCCEFDISDIDHDVVTEFRKAYLSAAGYQDWTDEQLLYQAGAIVKHEDGFKFTNAGLLFFASNPQRVLPYAYCRLLKFENNHGEKIATVNPSFDRSFSGPITKQIRQLRTFLKESAFFRSFQIRKPEGGFRDETEFPIIAIDESIVNAITHRDYAVQLPTQFCGYRDAFVSINSGTVIQRETAVPEEFDLAEFTLISTPRNSKLIEWLRVMKDEHGSEFVRALSEGTRRMQAEMQLAKLPAPSFKVTPWKTEVTLLNNLSEREKNYQAINPQSSEFANLFPLHFGSENGRRLTPEEIATARKEFYSVLKDVLLAKGWFVDKFKMNRITAHRQGVDLPLPGDARKVVRLYRGFTFQIREYLNKFYLSIDFSLQVRNVMPVKNLLRDHPWLELVGKTAIAEFGGWQPCKIVSADTEFTRAFLFDFEKEEQFASKIVIPNLNKTFLQRLLTEKGIRTELEREIKNHSLLLNPHSARRRWELIEQAATEVATTVFPLKLGEVVAKLSSKPANLKRQNPSNFELCVRSIAEPAVEFNHKHETADVRDGITRFGAYDAGSHEIEIVPVCISGYEDLLAKLIERIKNGKYKYRGSERTFNTRFHYSSVITCPTSLNIESQCARLIQEHPSWKGNTALNRIFLVQTPENDYALDDENSPYFRVKKLLLENGIPCQMIDTKTLQNADWKDLNLTLNLIAKCGVTPWVLPGAIPDADFFVGLSYTQSRLDNTQKLLGYANVFNSYGRWLFFSGSMKAVSYAEKAHHFRELVTSTMSRLDLSETPSIYFHSSAKFSRFDKETILAAARSIRPLGTFHFVWINSHHTVRFFDMRSETDGSLSRGSYVVTGTNQIYLSTTGYNRFRKLLGTPLTLEVNANIDKPAGDPPIKPDLQALATQLISLTKLNWASSDSLCAEPITTKYAGDIAYLTAAFLRLSPNFTLHQVLEKTPWFI